ncbi:MAG TPA: protein kinase, partial [Gemmatimonadaceae bacterium]
RAASALDHPSIATIYEIGETDDGRLFIALAYYGDETLRARIAGGPLPISDAVRIATQVAEGLRVAHARGIVHRDIKPANLLLTPDGGVRIIDFGIAKLAGGATTRPTLRLGTAAYMSPEQSLGDPVDARTDLWALGVVLYEMLTGVRPFRQERPDALIFGIRLDAPAPPTVVRPDTPDALSALVMRCLEKDPEQRFQSAEALLEALRALPGEDVPPGGSQTPADHDPSHSGVAAHALRDEPATVAPARRDAASGRRWRAKSLIAAVGTLVLATTIAVMADRGVRDQPGPGPPPTSLAVLPLVNVGNDPSNAYLADGITEDLLNVLAQVPGLRVAARTSSFAFREGGDVRAIGEQLDVRYLLEGSVQRAADRLRVGVRLVDAADGAPIWSRDYDRVVQDLFVVEDEISREVAAALRVRVLGIGDRIATAERAPDLETHDLYLRGRYAWNRRTEEGFNEAVGWFQAAIARDSTYAAAWAGLADAYRLLGTYGFLPGSEGFAAAEMAARRAVALAPRSAAARAALAGSLGQRSAADAEPAFRTALELDPNHADARHWYAFFLAIEGRRAEALEQIAKARALEPLSSSIRATEARLLLYAGEVERAVASLEEGLRSDSTMPWMWYALAVAYGMEERVDEAIRAAQRAIALVPDEPRLTSTLSALLAAAGDTIGARSIAERVRRLGGRESVAYGLAVAFAALGEADSAFAWLHRVPWNSEYTFSLRADPLLAPLRSDARYRALGAELGLPSWP